MYWEWYAWLARDGGFSGHRYQFRCVRKNSLAFRVANCRNLHRLPRRAASHVIYVESAQDWRSFSIFDGKLENVQYSFIIHAVFDTPWWATSRMRSTDDFFVTRFPGALRRRPIGIENISASQCFSVKIRLAEYRCSPFRAARGGNAPKVHYGDAVGRGDVFTWPVGWILRLA